MEKSTFLLEPMGMREMVQADHGLNASREQRLQQFAIALEGLRIPAPLLRLDASPLDRQTQRVQAEVAREIEIALGIRPPVTRPAARVPRTNPAGVLPMGPL